ncbi:ExbD/TolR family protein [Shimia sp. MMG029]|uniref:ExbD/TolR family protein n=1 Tax=Shimia sp. MMG029 TaxID=3021978 RepID=UPI0022FEF444|nr:biopolymer transporter ExbD [Shimia sp. MMG029]MDA5559079.1 biopolymer transporter ExbD [Shimia sp. MMG029]
MALSLAKRKRNRLSMTSLIDVIFLLLLFFMLTSTFSKFGEIELSSTGQSALAVSESKQVFVNLRSNEILLNGQTITQVHLIERLRDDPSQEKTVLIAIGQDTTSQELVDLLTALRKIPHLNTRVLQ